MKRYIKTYFTCGLILIGLLSACKEEDMTLGEGSVRLNVKVSDEVAVVSRSIECKQIMLLFQTGCLNGNSQINVSRAIFSVFI